jgi:hypothetical protein
MVGTEIVGTAIEPLGAVFMDVRLEDTMRNEHQKWVQSTDSFTVVDVDLLLLMWNVECGCWLRGDDDGVGDIGDRWCSTGDRWCSTVGGDCMYIRVLYIIITVEVQNHP